MQYRLNKEKVLQDLGYKPITGSGWKRKGEDFIFDLFRGKRIHTTELINSPLEKDNHIFIKEFSHIYLGILNYYDIIITKLFRGTGVDIDDCMALIKAKKDRIEINALKRLFLETASFDVSEERVKKNLDWFLKIINKEKIYGK